MPQNNHDHPGQPLRAAIALTAAAICSLGLNACSTWSPTQEQINAAGSEDEYWRANYQRQCINSGIQPGTPMMVKCVDDLMEIRAESPDPAANGS